jgi:uncharacterized membrane protein YqaE (UPF0057 family)
MILYCFFVGEKVAQMISFCVIQGNRYVLTLVHSNPRLWKKYKRGWFVFDLRRQLDHNSMALTCSDICKLIAGKWELRPLFVCAGTFSYCVAFILPPLGVLMERGCWHCDFYINILLTLLGFLPGILLAIYIIMKYWWFSQGVRCNVNLLNRG